MGVGESCDGSSCEMDGEGRGWALVLCGKGCRKEGYHTIQAQTHSVVCCWSMIIRLTEIDQELFRAAHHGHNFVILGQAGTGKSHIIKAVALTLRGKQRNVQVTASTGLAAVSGCTVHTFF